MTSQGQSEIDLLKNAKHIASAVIKQNDGDPTLRLLKTPNPGAERGDKGCQVARRSGLFAVLTKWEEDGRSSTLKKNGCRNFWEVGGFGSRTPKTGGKKLHRPR